MRPLLTSCLMFAFVGLAALTGAEPASEGIPQISWKDADDHYGQTCAVYGTIVATKDIGSRTFLNFASDFRTSFTAVIESKDYGKFPSAPHQAFLNQHVRVVGAIVEHRGKPEIVVESPAAITIVSDPTPPAGGAAATVETQGGEKESRAAEVAPPVAAWRMATDGTIRIATFNVLNLFDAHDDPYIRNEILPGKPAEEIALLAGAIRKLNADIVALQEVENRPFLREFVATHLADMAYREVVLLEGNNPRGIDVALLSRLPVGPVTSYQHLEFPDGNGVPTRFQRDLLQVRFAPEGRSAFDVFVVHLKSQHGGASEALPIRMGEAAAIRGIFDDMLRHNPGAAFVICGDFNDTLDSAPLQRILGAGSTALRGFVSDLPPDKQITYNQTHLAMIDFILASPAMATMYVDGSYDVLPGSIPMTGSDHNPVVATFRLSASGGGNGSE